MRCTWQIGLCVLVLASVARAEDAKEKKSDIPSTSQTYAANEITATVQDAKKTNEGGSITIRVEGVTLTTGGSRSMPRAKGSHQDYVFDLTSDAKIRIMHLPPLLDDNGKKVSRTPEELQKLKGNSALPGYQAEIGDVKPKQIVKVQLVKLRSAKGDDAKKLYVSRVIILGTEETHPNAKQPEKKGDKN